MANDAKRLIPKGTTDQIHAFQFFRKILSQTASNETPISPAFIRLERQSAANHITSNKRKQIMTDEKKTKAQPTKIASMTEEKQQLSSIESVVENGKAVISGDDSVIVAAVQDAIKNARTATFYVSHRQSDMVFRWYFTNERIKKLGMKPVSKEEKARIESELGVKETGSLYSNRIQCGCGAEYGAFEFVQQGIREHGREMVSSVLEFAETSVIRVNPPTFAVCPKCNQRLLAGHYYAWLNGYGCCSTLDIVYG